MSGPGTVPEGVSRRRRLLPRTFAGRLTLLLLVGFVLILAAGIAALVSERGELARGLDVAARAEQLAAVAALIARSDPEMRTLLVRAVSSRSLSVRLRRERPRYRFEDDPPRSLAVIADAVREGTDGPVEVGLIRSWHDDQGGHGPHLLPSLRRMVLIAGLSDGTWLELQTPLRIRPPWRPFRLLAWLLIIGLVALALGRLAARRFARPLERFAEAADRLGIDDTAAPLAEEGPSELRRAAASFNRMQRRVRRLIDDRALMLAAVAHDLRTALTRLRLRVETIDDEAQRAKAVGDLDAMRRMLDETLAFARDEAGDERRERTDLAALLQTMADDAVDAGQPVAYEGPDRLVVELRPVAFRRALSNLIDNAVRYGERATLRLCKTADGIELRVEDEGPGIAPERREEVFRPFFRLEPSRSRETGGTGLGLAIARSVVRRHGGEIVLENRAGGGFAVVVRLPAAAAS